ncbi:MAG: ParB N-terminal domain-containing protein [Halanaerobiales bacterium]|nr:ParB N-terminal domain-containing protein [Halanaerobiales bacterium]
MKYKELKVTELKPFKIRDLRGSVITKLTERIKGGFNPARPLSVVKDNGKYIIADGNHRYKVLRDLSIDKVPCIVYEGKDPYNLAVECNQDEDTYAPMDLFDWLDIIGRLKDDYTQEEIGNKIGWSNDYTSKHNLIIKKISIQVLNLARKHQEGRVDKKSTNVEFNFTEGWFRTSGLYDIKPEYQLKTMQSFINDNCNWSKSKLQRVTAKYKQWQEFIEIAGNKLYNKKDLSSITDLIENDAFKSKQQLIQKIDAFNQKAKNKLIRGDAVTELSKLEDASIDLVITDPPYGIDYSSNRSKFNEHVTKEKIDNDDNTAIELFENVLEVLINKTKKDAHFYVFTSWKVYPEFKQAIDKYLNIKNMIVWDKGNHGAGDLEGSWGNRHELIIFASKGNRPLNKRKEDIVKVNKLSSSKMIHPTQKPVELITELLEASVQKADVICDPFMGSGSTIKSAKQFKDINYIGIELDKERFEKAKSFINDRCDKNAVNF